LAAGCGRNGARQIFALRAGVALSIVQQQQQFVSFDLAARLAAAAEVSEAFF
jgi:hypothetical protein